MSFSRNGKKTPSDAGMGVGQGHWGKGEGLSFRYSRPLLKALTHSKWSYSTLLLKGVTQSSRGMSFNKLLYSAGLSKHLS